jgi:hypothetical protein
MNKYTAKFAKLTAEQSKELAEAMNASYNRPPEDEDTDRTKKDTENEKTE